MPEIEVWHVDAFATQPFCGNPAAVAFCDAELPTDAMQAIAREMNLSETVFILPRLDQRADYRARIFTVRREIPFAGHPSLAAAFAVGERRGAFRRGVRPILRQECGVGLVDIESEERSYGVALFVAQRAEAHTFPDVGMEELANAFGCATTAFGQTPIAVASTGVPWLLAEFLSIDTVRSLEPDFSALSRITKRIGAVGATVFSRQTSDPKCLAHLRSFAPAEGILEDPVCGSCHGAVAAHLLRHCTEQLPVSVADGAFLMEQGEEVHRPGFAEVVVRRRAATRELLVGGPAVVTMKGKLRW